MAAPFHNVTRIKFAKAMRFWLGSNATGAEITALPANLNLIGAVASARVPKVAVVPFSGGTDTAGGVFAWANPEGATILIDSIVLDVTTVATAACSLSVGVAANATTSAANLIDTLDVRTAVGSFDNFSNKGTNGKSTAKATASQFVTASKATGASAGVVGTAYITYFLA